MHNYLALLNRARNLLVCRVALLLLVLLCASPATLPQKTQKAKALKAFTLVRQITEYDKANRTLPAYTETLAVSSSGDWRYVATYPNGQVIETIYLWGKGVFFSDHANRQLVKFSDVGAGRPGGTTAAQLRANPNFIRTEYVLNRRAYVHRRNAHNYVEETYFAPALGPFPFKRINYFDTYTRVEEPMSLTFGEPDASQLWDRDYQLVEEKIDFDPKLSERIQEKPDPQYSLEAQSANISGEVVLQVIVDESGRVRRAAPIRNLPLLAQATMEAVYRARFLPAKREGKLVKVSGLVSYQFPPR